MTERSWAAAWLAARSRTGLDGAVDGTLLRAPARGGGWARGSMEVAEAKAWLQSALAAADVPADEVECVGTHSCKATALSWAAKAGLRGEIRRLLGGHSKASEQMVLEYSRDTLAEPLRQLDLVYADIRSGAFAPDAECAMRRAPTEPLRASLGLLDDFGENGVASDEEDMPEEPGVEAGDLDAGDTSASPVEEDMKRGEDVGRRSPSASSSSDDSSSSRAPASSDPSVASPIDVWGKSSVPSPDFVFYTNERTGTAHLADGRSTRRRTLCGLQLSGLSESGASLGANRLRCERCYVSAAHP